MQVTTPPTKFTIPFGNAAGVGFIRPIPIASQIGIQDGAASLTDGFPPLNAVPVASGGIPPFMQDMNGVLKQITQWIQLVQAGAVVPYDAAFQATIGGYPRGARVWSGANTGLVWQSQVDNNLTNPDTGGAGWSVPVFVDPATAGLIISGSGINGANLRFVGNGVVSPGKTVRVQNGRYQILNHAYSSVIFDMDDAGIATANGLRAAIGAFGSGDPNRVPNLSDFVLGSNANGSYIRFPNGTILMGGSVIPPTGNGDVFNMPTSFPSGVFSGASCDDGGLIADTSIIAINNSQYRLWCGYNNGGAPTYVGGSVGVVWLLFGT